MNTTNARNRRWLASVVIAAVAAGLLGACGNRASTEDIARAAMSINGTSASAPGQTPAAGVTANGAEAGTGTVEGTGTGTATGTPAAIAASGSSKSLAQASNRSASAAAGNRPAASGTAAGAVPASGATAAAANGSKSQPGTAPGTAAPTAGGPCSTPKAPVVIGSVGNQSGIVGAAVYPGVKAVQAWISAQNEKGGLDCHPIKYVVADDGGDPSRNLTLTKQLVEQEKVIGFVYNDAVLSGQASADYIKQKQVPVMGQEGGSTYFDGSNMHFSAGSNGTQLIDLTMAGTAHVTVPQNKTKVATMTCQEATWCNLAHERWPKLAGKFGYSVVYQAKASLTQPDFTSQCLSAQNAGATVVLGAFDPNAWKRVAQSCAQVGFKPVYGAPVMQTRQDFKDDPNLEGMVIPEPNMPWFLGSSPTIAEFQSTLKRYAPGLEPNAATLAGWAAVKLFERAGHGYLSDTPTSRDFLRGLWTFKDETLGGLAPPLTFPEMQAPTYPTCGWPVVIKGGTFVNDGKIQCFG